MQKRGTEVPLLLMEVVRYLELRSSNQPTLYARTATLFLQLLEVSHISISKSSITLRFINMSCIPKNTMQNYNFSAKIELNLQKKYIDYGIFAVLTQKGIGLSSNSLPL